MEPVLVVTIVLLFASSVVVDGLVHAASHLAKVFDDLAHRPVVYGGHGLGARINGVVRSRPARPAVLR